MLNCVARAHGARRPGVVERGTFLASAKYFAPICRRFRRDCLATGALAHTRWPKSGDESCLIKLITRFESRFSGVLLRGTPCQPGATATKHSMPAVLGLYSAASCRSLRSHILAVFNSRPGIRGLRRDGRRPWSTVAEDIVEP